MRMHLFAHYVPLWSRILALFLAVILVSCGGRSVSTAVSVVDPEAQTTVISSEIPMVEEAGPDELDLDPVYTMATQGTGFNSILVGETTRQLAQGLGNVVGLTTQGQSFVMTDAAGGRLLQLDPFQDPVVLAEGLNYPVDVVAVGRRYYVLQGNGELVRVMSYPSGARITPVIDGLPSGTSLIAGSVGQFLVTTSQGELWQVQSQFGMAQKTLLASGLGSLAGIAKDHQGYVIVDWEGHLQQLRLQPFQDITVTPIADNLGVLSDVIVSGRDYIAGTWDGSLVKVSETGQVTPLIDNYPQFRKLWIQDDIITATGGSSGDLWQLREPGPAPDRVTRLIAMGDTGEGNATQYRVAEGAQARCDRTGGCDGFLMLGDNIYDDGAQSPTDPQFDTKIDQPYANLKLGPPQDGFDTRPRMPIYVTLGNHDLGGAGLNSFQIRNYLLYAQDHNWFYYPAEFYDTQVGNVHLISVHTNPMAYLGQNLDVQGSLVDRVVQTTSADWTIAIGHHPYRSNGVHGNAGSYEGIPGDLVVLGGAFREWIDTHVCNQVDFYLSGHDHNRQWLASVPPIPTWPPQTPIRDRIPCSTHFAVSGAGSKSRDLENRRNELAFGSDQVGFLFLEFHQDYANVEFCDADGNTEWSQVITR